MWKPLNSHKGQEVVQLFWRDRGIRGQLKERNRGKKERKGERKKGSKEDRERKKSRTERVGGKKGRGKRENTWIWPEKCQGDVMNK